MWCCPVATRRRLRRPSLHRIILTNSGHTLARPPMTRSFLLYVSVALTLSFVPPPNIVEYPLPRPKAFPHDPAVGADGIVWYTDQANSYIGRLDPATGKVTDYATPTPVSGPHGIVVAPPPDGGVWYTANFKGRLGRLDPATGAIKEYPLPAAATDPHTPLYHAGKVWFTAQGANLYGVLDPATGRPSSSPCRPRAPTPTAWSRARATAPSGWRCSAPTRSAASIPQTAR